MSAAYSIPDCFMTAFFCGAAFGLVYEALRAVRVILRARVVVFVCDVLFFLLAAAFLFKLSPLLGNYVRVYTLIGFGAGVFCYIVTLGRLFNLAENAVADLCRRTIGRFFRFLRKIIGDLFGKVAHKAKAAFGKIAENTASLRKNMGKLLHLRKDMVYNDNVSTSAQRKGEGHVIKASVRKSPRSGDA